MYRIDENTSIDESLVTCAEYQLFIDEMRAQGQFFQPDHWTSWQFPAGQARAPILGVRPSDAQAFCDWLSRREERRWCFRLPTADEAAGYPIQKQDERFSGFWTLNGDEHSFTWIGPAPVDARGIDFSYIFARARARAIARELDLASDFALANDLNLARARACSRALDLDIARGINIVSDLACARDRARDLASDLASNRARDHAHALDQVLSIWIDLITMQERIAGRSPAFEGIRLVKERKQD